MARHLRVVSVSPLRDVATAGEIHCPKKQGIVAFERCVGWQRDTAAAGHPCTCDSYRNYRGRKPVRDEEGVHPNPPRTPSASRPRRIDEDED